MRLFDPDMLDPGTHPPQVWMEASSLYPHKFAFRSESPYWMRQFTPFGFFSEDGILLDNSRALFAFAVLEEAGYEVMVSAEADAMLHEYYGSKFCRPPTMKEDFVPYGFQSREVMRMLKEDVGLFVHPTGTGKTITALMMIATRIHEGEIDRAVVWCPSHLVKGWVRAVERFTHLTVDRLDKGTPDQRRKRIRECDAQVLVLNYEKMRSIDKDEIIGRFGHESVMFVYDESQRLKNRTRKLHKEMAKTLKAMGIRYQAALSATPVEKSPVDLYNIFRLLSPRILGLVKDFEREYTLYDGAKDVFGNYLGFQNLYDMRFRIDRLISTVNKSDPEVASEFPDMQEIILTLELSPEDRALYTKMRDRARREVKDAIEEGRGSIVASKYTRILRKICSLPEALLVGDDDELQKVFEATNGLAESKYSVKVQATKELVSSIIEQGSKVIVFYAYTHHGILLLQRHFEEYDPLLYYGEMSTDEKSAVEDIFRNSTDRNLMFVSNAGREGLNLPEAEYVIHFDTPYLWTHYRQRSDRIHRIDSDKKNVFIYRFLTDGTLEERIEETMLARRDMAIEMGVESVDGYEPSVADSMYLLFGKDDDL